MGLVTLKAPAQGAVEAAAAAAPFCCMHACMEQYPGGRAPGQGVHARTAAASLWGNNGQQWVGARQQPSTGNMFTWSRFLFWHAFVDK